MVMQAFPTKLKYMCICLSEVIFMEGFMRKIYNFINGLEILHLIGKSLYRKYRIDLYQSQTYSHRRELQNSDLIK